MYLTVEPAYGAQYNSQREVRDAFNADKDFRVLTIGAKHGYLNKSDLERYAPGVKLEVRYGKNGTKVMILP